MKRLLALLLTLLLAVSAAPSLCLAEDDGEDLYAWDDFFLSQYGHIRFTLPRAPELFYNQDVTEEEARDGWDEYAGWLDMRHVFCIYSEDEVLELFAGDLSPMISQMRKDYPGEDERNYQASALSNLITQHMTQWDGMFVDFPKADVIQRDGKDYVTLQFTFRYGLARDNSQQAGRGIMDGSRAVLMFGTDSEFTRHYLALMDAVGDQEAADFKGLKTQTLTLNKMHITLPGQPEVSQEEDVLFCDTYGPDFTYITIQYLSLGAYIQSDKNTVIDLVMKRELTNLGDGYVKREEMGEYTVEKVRDGLWRLKGAAIPYEGDETTWNRARYTEIYLTVSGLYRVSYDDSQAGRDAAASIVIEP